jgi:hypothetical protein
MPDDLSFRVRILDATRAGLGRARSAISTFATRAKAKMQALGKSIAQIGKVSFAILAAGVGLAVRAYMKQEEAEVRLEAAMRNTGSAIEQALVPSLKRYASHLQDLTRFGDEAIIEVMAYGKTLGISALKMKDATKAAIGLTVITKNLRTAMMLIGRAVGGDTALLSKYGIKLDETLSPQEKLAKLMEMGAGMFDQAAAETDTLAGALDQLKGRIGDAFEKLGEGLTGAEDAPEQIKKIGDAVKELTESGDLEKWGGILKETFRVVLGVIQEMVAGIAGFSAAIGALLEGNFKGVLDEAWAAYEEFSYVVKKEGDGPPPKSKKDAEVDALGMTAEERAALQKALEEDAEQGEKDLAKLKKKNAEDDKKRKNDLAELDKKHQRENELRALRERIEAEEMAEAEAGAGVGEDFTDRDRRTVERIRHRMKSGLFTGRMTKREREALGRAEEAGELSSDEAALLDPYKKRGRDDEEGEGAKSTKDLLASIDANIAVLAELAGDSGD